MTDQRLYRLAYEAPSYLIEHLDLTFHLDPKKSLVESRFTLKKSDAVDGENRFRLNGSSALTLLEIEGVSAQQVIREGDDLLLIDLPQEVTLSIKNEISPEENQALVGLFMTDGLFCSDCEPQGFRSITYFADRPDIMATYRVKIIADQKYPILLSNGNLEEKGDLEDGKHYAIWHDPFPKPTYLFALVAGDLAYIEDQHIRPDGSAVELRIYAQAPFIDQCHFALQSLKRAMKWDEERFGLICDLDYYNIVAVNDFNGGAMENKGLNIFNSKFVLADPQTATDDDFRWVDAVIAHEYFHNWTGNRITCQDWFNLSLKEGLTVFREQEYMADHYHAGIKRIEDVKILRREQFPEDAGPLAHPIRPDSVKSIANLYTTTIYEKGAEVVRLYHTILGEERFQKGFAEYIRRHDGEAVTTDHFLSAMEYGFGRTLPNFEYWYSQAGTPQILAETFYDEPNKILRLSLRQRLTSTPEAQFNEKHNQVIPIKYALMSQTGELLLEETFVLQEAAQCLMFHNIEEHPTPIFMRQFSAPVTYHYDYSLDQLELIITHETDHFARWDAAQTLYRELLLNPRYHEERTLRLEKLFRALLMDQSDPQFLTLLLSFPALSELMQERDLEPDLTAEQLHNRIDGLKRTLAETFSNEWSEIYQRLQSEESAAARSLKNYALTLLSYLPQYEPLIQEAYEKSQNMSDRLAALRAIIERNLPQKEEVLTHFATLFADHPNVIDRWFSLQASAPTITLDEVEALSCDPRFSYSNPNRVRALLSSIGRNLPLLAREGAPAFRWLFEAIKRVDAINPQTAARLLTPFSRLELHTNNLKEEVLSLLKSEKGHTFSPNFKEQLEQITKEMQ